jgi:hypothetical protein
MSFVAVGLCLWVVSFVGVHLHREEWNYATIGSLFFLCAGVVGISTCPLEDVDFDRTMETRPSVRHAVFLMLLLLSIALSIAPPHVHVLHFLLILGGAWLPRISWRPRESVLVSWWLILLSFGDSVRFFYYTIISEEQTKLMWLAPACGLFLSSALIAGLWLRQRCRGASSTLVLYQVLHGSLLGYGFFGLFLLGAGFAITGREPVTYIPLILNGSALIFPPALVLAMGSNRVFHFMARHLDRDQGLNERDGAFIAELLANVGIEVGQTWWILRSDKDFFYPLSDPRHHWQPGQIEEIGETEMSVSLSPPEPMMSMRRTMTSMTSMSRTSSRRPTLTPTTSTIDRNRQDGIGDRVRVPLGARMLVAHQILDIARRGLQCVDWLNITLELLFNSACAAHHRNLGRLVRVGERIDFFMSHSWYDDPLIKFEKLQELANTFYDKHGRYPTFWLDKVCIDQNAIADGLRALPVYVMACNKMLVLCGETYPQRLWCVWELCTLLSFIGVDTAAERIELVSLASPDVFCQLNEFDVSNAHCFDPNEESKLMTVIEAVGAERFNRKIHELALACQGRGRSDTSWSKGSSMACEADEELRVDAIIDSGPCTEWTKDHVANGGIAAYDTQNRDRVISAESYQVENEDVLLLRPHPTRSYGPLPEKACGTIHAI